MNGPRRARLPLGPVVISLAAGVILLLAGLFVNGCRISKLLSASNKGSGAGGPGGGGGGGSGTSPIVIVPSEVSDSALLGASEMRMTNLTVANGGAWAASATDPWIHVNPVSGGPRGTMRLALDPKSLTPGPHQGSVTVRERQTDGSSFTVPVTFLIQQPILKTDPESFNFTARTSSSVFLDTLVVSNAGNGPLVWTATTENNAAWLTLGATQGTGPGLIPIRATNADLSYFGTFKETIIITAPGAKDSPARIEVTLRRKKHGDAPTP